ENIEKESIIYQILNEESSSIQNFKEVLKENLYKSTELRMSEKYNIIKILQKKDITEEDDYELKLLLNKLSKKELTSLLGRGFKNYSRNQEIPTENIKPSATPLSFATAGRVITPRDSERHQRIRAFVLKQLDYYSKTGERLNSMAEITSTLKMKRDTGRDIARKFLKDLFKSNSKVVYDMIFGKAYTSIHKVRQAVAKAGFILKTTATEWFQMVKNRRQKELRQLKVNVKCIKEGHITYKAIRKLPKPIFTPKYKVKSSYIEKIIIKAAMEYLTIIKGTYKYSPDVRNLNFKRSIAVDRILDMKKMYESYVSRKIPHHVIYRIQLKKSGILKKSLFPRYDFLTMPFTSKIRIGQAIIKYETGNIRTLKTRIGGYLSKAFNINPIHRSQDTFSKDLRAMVGLSDLETDKKIISKKKEMARSMLKVDILHISFSREEINAAERFWIFYFKTLNPNYGYNIQLGGSGTHRARIRHDVISILNQRDLTFFDIDMVLKDSLQQGFFGTGGAKEFVMDELGLSRFELDSILKYFYDDLVQEHFPGKSPTFSTVKDLYIGNKIINLMDVGFWNRDEIGKQIGLKMRDASGEIIGSSYNRLEQICRRIFKKGFDDLKMEKLDIIIFPEVRKRHMKGQLSYTEIAEFVPGMDGAQIRYWMDKIYGYRIPSSTSFRTGSRDSSGLEELRRLVKRDIVIPLLILNVDGDTILKTLGYIPGSDGRFRDKQEYFRKIFNYGENNRVDETTARLIFTGQYIPPKAWNQFNKKFKPWWEHLKDFLDGFY
ncbi:hypothetical protein LCGC14_1625780, partial [marine sediment metagenome]